MEVGTDLGEQDTNYPDTKLRALRRATIALGEQAPLSESKTFFESAKFSFDNLGPYEEYHTIPAMNDLIPPHLDFIS